MKRKDSAVERAADDLDRYSDQGISFRRREMYVGEITQASAVRFHKNLLALDTLSSKPITIHFHSSGGSEDAGWAMYDALRLVRSDVYGFAWGTLASMATIIILACDHRYIGENTTFMLHEGSASFEGSEHIRNSVTFGRETERRLEIMYQVYERHTKLSKKDLRKLMTQEKGGDVYLSVEDTVKFGFVHGIVDRNRKIRK